jgi:dynein light chain roadblock-type
VRTSGLLTAEEIVEDGSAVTGGTHINGSEEESVRSKGTRNAEEVAQLVWAFVKSAGAMVEKLNGENDEAKLLRLRTKKNELVIVPGKAIRYFWLDITNGL